MKVLAIVQARLTSSRFPKKILKEIKGKSLIEILISRLKLSTKIDRIIVAIPKNNKEHILKLVKMFPETKHITQLLPETLEQFYYRYVFELHYKHCGKVIPYFWMPKYVNAQDSSARTLDIYNDDQETNYAILPNAPDEIA